MAKTFTGYAPFAYDNEYYLYTDRKKAEKEKFITFMEQRNAKYKTPAKEVYNNKGLTDEELKLAAFMGTIEVPTPQLMTIDGYDPEKEASTDNESESTPDEGGDNGEGATPSEPETPFEEGSTETEG